MHKILHIIGSGSIGGAENIAYTLAKYQNELSEHQTTMLFCKGRGYFYEKAKVENINCFVCPENIGLSDFVKLVQIFKKYDIHHFHGLYPLLFLCSMFSGKRAHYFIHGARSLTKSTKETVVNFTKNGKLPTIRGGFRFIKRKFLIYFLKNKCKSIVAPSEYYQNFYAEKYLIPINKITIIPLGVNPGKIQTTLSRDVIRKQLGISEDEFVIGTVSTFRRLKRIDRLLDIFQKYYQINKTSKLLLIGDGETMVENQEMVRSFGIEKNVIFTGLKNNTADYLQAMDWFILPSEFESFSLGIVEAMFMKLPVAVFKGSCGAEELVRKAGGYVGENVEDIVAYLGRGELIKSSTIISQSQFCNENLTLKIFIERLNLLY